MSHTIPLHAGLVAFHTVQGWRGVLVRGASGAGKSDLTLRLLTQGWRLVADDRVLLWRSGERLWGRAAPRLQHLLEVRSVGVVPTPALAFVEIRLVIDCCSTEVVLDRIPLPDEAELCGERVRRLAINPFEISAAHKIQAYCDAERL